MSHSTLKILGCYKCLHGNISITVKNMKTNVHPSRACAACKQQRKKCDLNCQFARYFPPNKAEEFQQVAKHFGATNFLRLLNGVSESERDAAAKSLILEAKFRKMFPVAGSVGVVRHLQEQIEQHQKELSEVRWLIQEKKLQKNQTDELIINTPPQYDASSSAGISCPGDDASRAQQPYDPQCFQYNAGNPGSNEQNNF